MRPIILEECEVDQDSGPGIQRLKRTGAALGDDKGPRDDGFEEARRADVPTWEGLLQWEHSATQESPNVDGQELVLRSPLFDLERLSQCSMTRSVRHSSTTFSQQALRVCLGARRVETVRGESSTGGKAS